MDRICEVRIRESTSERFGISIAKCLVLRERLTNLPNLDKPPSTRIQRVLRTPRYTLWRKVVQTRTPHDPTPPPARPSSTVHLPTPNETVGAGGVVDFPSGEEYVLQLGNHADIVAVGEVAVESVQFCRLMKGTSVF
ncbi:uncharacterized protein STEHIDRAFT_160807 [Stereum hirsutum FP-91666 SS1]|uniref:uncharacterized protein n=1 Tax=Stereum hirsutum (strain FP-91666) TaxID=721885 RepID=UPI000444935D|nr:uncharacterized protein STEHIDRAFT_160807 [Stereum hirsutum FP-91666 SS1]EIM82252.1 hypothetical protein STEHIDRAFT_160807 [Stereum hirsutum FP-91666 SS1]